jgi:tetratricopeptide (TPR) repeat protein
MAMRELREVASRERLIWERLRADPDNADMKQRAEAEFRNVITAYENVIRSAPEFAEAYAAYGLILSRTGNREAAVKAFLKANKLDPRLALVKNQLGNFLAEEGNYKEALPYYLAAIELEPEEPLYHYQLGALLHEYRRLFVADILYTESTVDEKSHDAFRRAAELAPDNWGYAYRYAESFYDAVKPDWDAALVEWRKLEARAKPGLEVQTIRLHIARVLVEADRNAEAGPILETITEPALQEHKQTVIAAIQRDAE